MSGLYMLLAGCSPPGRNTEQHDVFFAIAENVGELIPILKRWWPEAGKTLHLDAWRRVTYVDGYKIEVTEKTPCMNLTSMPRLFFINLGGYKENEFDEFHYKLLVVAPDKGEAVRKSKQTAFFKHTTTKKARSHVDDKFGIDVDDIYEIQDVLPENMRNEYSLVISNSGNQEQDEINLGYFKLNDFKKKE